MKLFLLLLSLTLTVSGQGELASCFCQLEGVLEDCPCKAASVDSFNTALSPRLISLLESYYFRYFQVDFSRPCLFRLGEEGACSNSGCAVDVCTEEDVPECLKGEHELHRIPEEKGFLGRAVGGILTAFPVLEPYYTSAWDLLATWGLVGSKGGEDPVDHTIPDIHRNLLNDFCPLDPLEEGASCQYVDLVANTERFTGYSGRAAQVVWEKVYNELCFHPEKDGKTFQLNAENMKSMCFEKRAFYRVISGLHASISVHITSNYLLQEPNIYRAAVWGRNLQEFTRRFSPATTDGEGPERLKNLYFLYLLELRALAKAAPLLEQVTFNSGNPREDGNMKKELSDLLVAVKEFPDHFDESSMFSSAESRELFAAFKDNFSSISRLMDCLGCERCTVWGKVQITGIGTALKILFTDPSSLSLSRHELVALLNAFGRISTSVQELDGFRKPLSSK